MKRIIFFPQKNVQLCRHFPLACLTTCVLAFTSPLVCSPASSPGMEALQEPLLVACSKGHQLFLSKPERRSQWKTHQSCRKGQI